MTAVAAAATSGIHAAEAKPAGSTSPSGAIERVFGDIDSKQDMILSHISSLHSAVEGFTDEEVIGYFNEVCLYGEYDGFRDCIIKYDKPIRYALYGEPSQEDIAHVEKLMEALNSVEGFPGISPASGDCDPEMKIYFSSETYFESESACEVPEYSWGYASVLRYIYGDMKGEITNSDVWISEDAHPQLDRNSVICEEIIQSLGLLNDPEYGYYSIFDQNRNDCEWPSALDWAVISAFYDRSIRPGDNAADALRKAEAFIRGM